MLPQTTTALPFKDLEWTRKLVDLHCARRSVPARFSILSTKVLHIVHDNFTPEELLPIELVQQQEGSVVVKSRAGRIVDGKELPEPPGNVGEIAQDMGTIACVSGFLVNMVQRTAQLVSPCRASEEWPLGYRVFAAASFDSAEDLRGFMEQVIEGQMAEHLPGAAAAAFRADLSYLRDGNGFTVSTPYRAHRFEGAPFLGDMGDLITRGDRTVGDTIGALLEAGADVFAVTGALDALFQSGLLNERAAHESEMRAEAVSS